MTKREQEEYVNGYRYGASTVLTYGYRTLFSILARGYVNGSREYTAGMCDAGIALAQAGVK